jgi:predicted transcriptional regulator
MVATALSVKLTQVEKQRLAKMAKTTKRSSHYVVREALLNHIDKFEWEQSFHEEAEAAWRDYKETGLHLSLETMEKWAASGGGKLPPWER